VGDHSTTPLLALAVALIFTGSAPLVASPNRTSHQMLAFEK
jgi:hypothetical protein